MEEFPLSPQLRRLWLLSRQGGTFRSQVVVGIEPGLDADGLRRALGCVVKRHEILRTTLEQRPWMKIPQQVVHPEGDFRWSVEDLSREPLERREERVRTLAAQGWAEPVDPAARVQLSARLLVLSAGQQKLLLDLPAFYCDRRSLIEFVREIGRVYSSFGNGSAAPGWDEDPLQYVDFSEWQADLTAQEDEAGAELRRAYWIRSGVRAASELAVPGELQLAEPGFECAAVALELARHESDVERVASGHGIGAHYVLLAAWQAYLGRLTGRPRLTVGAVFDGRKFEELHDGLGLFARCLPVEAALGDDPTFSETLDRVAEAVRAADEWQEYGIPEKVDELDGEQIRFPFQFEHDASPLVESFAGSVFTLHSLRSSTEPFKLKLACSVAERLTAELQYDRSVIARQDAERMAEQLGGWLRQALADPGRRLSALELISDKERRRLLVEFNAVEAVSPSGSLFPRLFAAQARRSPGLPAVVCGGVRLDYGELDARSNQLAHHLRRVGVGPESRVALLLRRSAETMVAMLGVVKAGGAYVPLDPAFPAARLRALLEDAGAAVLVSEESLAAGLGEGGPARVLLDRDGSRIAARSTEEPPDGAGAGNLMYVLFTSGSTGRPKGVAVEHRQVSNYLAAILARLDLGEEPASFATVSTLAADLGNTMIFPALATGGCLHVLTEDVVRSPEAMARYFREHRIDCLKIVPSHLAALLASGSADVLPRRRLVLGGEAAAADLVRDLERLAPRELRVLNHYGPTETTVGVVSWAVEPGRKSWPLGRPLANVRLYVLDARLGPVGAGMPGEIFVGGANVARGYLGRPAATAERFLPDRFEGVGERLYRTGDRARFDDAAELVFLGRVDHQVKVRGFRVELGEVESALAEEPGVSEAVAVVREGAIFAYVVPRRGEVLATEALRESVGQRLAEYMRPAAVTVLDALPLTPNGKIDRAALPAPGSPDSGGSGHVAPRHPIEEVLATIFSEVLGVDRVGVFDDFFDLGGHSLLAVRVAALVRQALGVELGIQELFDQPRIEALARIVAEKRAGEDDARRSPPPLLPVPREGELPLSFGQERLWFIDQFHPGGIQYNIPLMIRAHGPLDREALGRALREVVARHEVLRTRFANQGGRPLQVIDPAWQSELAVEDLAAVPAAELEAAALEAVSREVREPFDLAGGPLLRAKLVRLSDREHILVIVTHHIVFDGSLDLLPRELAELYRALTTGQPASLPDLAVQYADYAAWQRGWFQGEVLEEHLGYWRAQLAGAPQVLELPLDRPRPAVMTNRGARARFALPPELDGALRRRSRREGVTLFMTLLSGFAIVLSRLSGQRDLVVGTPLTDRPSPEVENLIGCFVETLVLRTSFDGDPPARELLARMREVCLGAYAHREVPFELLVEALQPERDASHTPIFQVMFGLVAFARQSLELGELTLEPRPFERETARFDLLVNLREGGDVLTGSAEYNRDLFDRTTAERLVAQLKLVLAALAENADVRLSRLAWLSPAEAHQAAIEWNDTAAAAPAARSLHELFERRVDEDPGAPAVWTADARLSYGELEERSNRVARRLIDSGVGRGSLVAVDLARTPELVVALVAVLKAGAAYVPFDDHYPEARIEWILSSLDVRVVVTDAARLGKFDRLARATPLRDVVVLGDAGAAKASALRVADRTHLDALAPARPRREVAGEDLAYIIFTSGTTGTPKGVTIRHASAVGLVEWVNRTFGIGARDRLLFVTSPCFDLSVYDIFGVLAAGGSLRMATEGELASPERLLAVLVEERVTFWDSAPAALQQILPFLTPAEPGTAERETLRLVFLSGDWIPVSLPGQVRGGFPRAGIVSLGGATEATVWSNVFPVGDVDPSWVSIPYGRPIDNARYHVLDGALRPCPTRVAGDLFIGGDCLAVGYAGDARLSAEKLLADPWSVSPGGRLYRTGDRARFWTDGTLEFLGRRDHQVKIRGFRVELGEIESVLASHAGVRDAVAVARPDAAGHNRLVAYVVPSPASPSVDELRWHLAARLPDYMMPAAFVLMDALPMTPNGKLDRRALPDPDFTAPASGGGAPATPIEEVVADVWAEVLALDGVERHANFFELGGHSLVATQVLARIRKILEVDLPLQELFENPTLAGFAAAVESARRGEEGRGRPPLGRAPREGALPQSFAQQRLWFLEQLQPGSSAYVVPAAIRVRGDLDPSAFRAGLTEVVRRHEALRTVFAAENGEPVQRVLPAAPVPLPFVDLRACPVLRRAGEERRLITREARRPFDLARGPIVRATLVLLDDERSTLMLTLHHIACDGWSIDVLVRELGTLYETFRAGGRSSLPELAIQYPDFAVWQRTWLRGDDLERQLAHWRTELGHPPQPPELPYDRPAPAVPSLDGETHGDRVPAALVGALEALGRRAGATLSMVLLAAFEALIHRYTGAGDLVVGIATSGRNRVETEDLIGFFINTLVVRTDLTGDPTFEELLARVRTKFLQAHTRQDLPFEKLVEELQPERRLTYSPLFQLHYSPVTSTQKPIRLPGLELEPLGVRNRSAKVPLAFEAVRTEILATLLTYSTALFDETTVALLCARLQYVLRDVAGAGDRRLSELPLLSDAQRHELVVEWNRTPAGVQEEAAVHERIAGWANREPQAVAAVFEGAELTYRELDERAARLALALRGLGVGPDVPVGLCVEPSLDLVVSIQAVWKAGGAYLPIDPAYPRERQSWLLEDAGVPVLLTQSRFRDIVPASSARVLEVDSEEALAAAVPRGLATALPPVAGHNTAYVIYTSGSTGLPKGVMVHHAGLASFTRAMADELGLGVGDRFLQFASLSFDASAVQIFPTLASGATLVLHRNPRALSSRDLLAFCAETEVTVLDLPAALWRQWVGDLMRSGETVEAPIRMYLTGGETVPGELLRGWAASMDREVSFLSSYGPTETTVTATVFRTTRDRVAGLELEDVPIGRPMAHARVHLLDERHRSVPVGVAGELFIGGLGVARGYSRHPRLTAESFVPDPFSSSGGTRLYRTGDRARWRRDGRLHFLGRLDHQVKLRGYRIELEEIEACLESHEAVGQAVALVRELHPGDERLVAYVEPAAGRTADAAQVRQSIRSRLPEYMVPAAVVVLDRLPVTRGGKVDRQALSSLEGDLYAAESPYVAPETELEVKIAEVWAEVLGAARVGLHENFFDLGGHSLLSIRLQSRLREELGHDIALVDLFRAPTVAAQARLFAGTRQPTTAVEEGDQRAAARLDSRRRRSRRRETT